MTGYGIISGRPILFVGFKYQIGGASERLDEIAQAIAECDGETAF